MAVVFLSFMIIGMALPVLPLHVHDVLGFGPFVVGVVAGGQFTAALISRLWAGRLSDTHGAKRAVSLGLVASVISGVFYLASLLILHLPVLSVALIVIGRTLLGGAESLIITGGIAWGLGLVSAEKSAKVIAWVGMAMFGALAVGAPLGSFVFANWAFFGIALVTTLVPVAALATIRKLPAPVPEVSRKASVSTVLGAVALPGIGFALSGITFGSITSFLTLYFSESGWDRGALAFTTFAVALIAARVFGGDLPDRFGGARVALYCLVIQAIGLAMIGFAGSQALAILGAAICGAGFSLVFPSLGLEAVRRAPAGSRGLAMGTYNAFLDLTLGLGSPALGWLGGTAGLSSIFIGSAVAALLAVPIALHLLRKPARANKVTADSAFPDAETRVECGAAGEARQVERPRRGVRPDAFARSRDGRLAGGGQAPPGEDPAPPETKKEGTP
jgi:MFS family permease